MKNIISLDETSIDSHIFNNYGWSKSKPWFWQPELGLSPTGKKGTKIENIVRHSKVRYSLILAINCKKIIHKKIIKGSANGEIFLKFIKDLVKKLHTQTNNYILLDNARIHHFKKIKEFIDTESKIKLIYNIPNAGNLKMYIQASIYENG